MKKNYQATWMLHTKKADFFQIAERFHINPVTARLIRNRDVVGDEAIGRYLYGTLQDLHDPHKMKDMDRATALLKDKIGQGRRIRVVARRKNRRRLYGYNHRRLYFKNKNPRRVYKTYARQG